MTQHVITIFFVILFFNKKLYIFSYAGLRASRTAVFLNFFEIFQGQSLWNFSNRKHFQIITSYHLRKKYENLPLKIYTII